MLNDQRTNPESIRTGSRNKDDRIPINGTAIPEKIINPIADPVRSELYTAEVYEAVVWRRVSSRKMLPVIRAGIKPDNIRIPTTATRPFILNMLWEANAIIT